MGLKGKFHRAARFVDRLRPPDRRELRRICADIRRAEKSLMENAGENMRQCVASCGGICCKNIFIDAIIETTDFIFLMGAEVFPRDDMASRLAGETLFFTADCIFLKDGQGPCIFPNDVKPKVCVITFCGDETQIRSHIRQVRKTFRRLEGFILRKRLRFLMPIDH